MIIPDQQISPAVQALLDTNNFELRQVLRYGPRYATLKVHNGEIDGLFKTMLPTEEQDEFHIPEELEARIVKEAEFLQYFSQQMGSEGFEPRVIAYSAGPPAWSLRSFITGRSMSSWDSTFVFREAFYDEVSPEMVTDFFRRLHELSDDLPQNLRDHIRDFRSALLMERRIYGSFNILEQDTDLAVHKPAMIKFFHKARQTYADYRPVVTHYEPFSPHLFVSRGKIGFIDWENIGWGHMLQDLSVFWMRHFSHPDWQREYLDILQAAGYLDGHLRLYWQSEMLIQALALIEYFGTGPIGTPEYDQAAMKFFRQVVRAVLVEDALGPV